MRSMQKDEAYKYLCVPTGYQVRQTPDSSVDGLVNDLHNSARWNSIHATLCRMCTSEYLLRVISSCLSARVLGYDTDDGPGSYRVTAGVPQGTCKRMINTRSQRITKI
ncbi:hypothetical protein TKK_0017705 [Trichogramma kaykai]